MNAPNAQGKPSKTTFRNLALGFSGAMFIAAFALYASKKHVEGRRKTELAIYEAELAQAKMQNFTSSSRKP
ncbi:hypothetical protein DFJ43DRAFT_1159953 [Lentinula guzmanii]|uniref:Uncharacterized protein n=1 Tax=Lentinula guzmanii TaxID=2804957 RepID=A0AA38MWM1_9AGAR|nr:hypothetical protein DFJ43DRAFT_1159953 [Lentinula guzmanii]